MDHDRLFKELLSTFFVEFVDLFLPDVSAYLDRDVVLVPMDKELFPDIGLGIHHEVDLLAKAKFRGKDAYFLIHVENQASAQSDFPERMFRYFACLTLKYNLPVYPMVVFTYDKPARPEPASYHIGFPGRSVLNFDYVVIQLNRLSWRDFVNQPNPVASALMAKMKMSQRERPKVKSECLRLLASLKLDMARTKIIGVFIDAYLKLTAKEMKQYEHELEKLAPVEREATMELISSWEKIGIEKGMQQGVQQGVQQGLHQGKEELLALQLEQRFSTLPANITERLDRLTSDQLNDLGRALLSFTSLTDLDDWLASR